MARDRPSPYGERVARRMEKDRFSQSHIKVLRTWITGHARFSIDIQVLTDLRRRFPDAERRRAEGVPNPLILGILLQAIGLARDRPSPYGGRISCTSP